MADLGSGEDPALIVDSGATQPRGRLCTDPDQVRIRSALVFSSTIGPFKYSRQTSLDLRWRPKQLAPPINALSSLISFQTIEVGHAG